MSAEKAEPGDVFVTRGIKEIDWSRRLCVRGYMVEEEGGALKGLCDARDDLPTGFLFNLPALLSGDPSAWAAALRFAPPEVLTAAFIAQCEADGRTEDLREGYERFGQGDQHERGGSLYMAGVLVRLGLDDLLPPVDLTALLESPEAGSEESKRCEA